MNPSYALAVLCGGFIAGALDIVFAISFAAYNGSTPVRLLQVVASGVFGKAAFDGGLPMAAAGLALHFVLSLLWAGAYLLLMLCKPPLAAHAWLNAIVFGVIVFLGMRLVLLPLSAFPFPVSFKPLATLLDLLSHMFLFGLPITLAVRRALAGASALS